MYEISIEQDFDAAHFLRGYRGKCEALHGHRFHVVIRVKANAVDDIGIAYDFTELKRHLNTITTKLDHVCLNDISPFDRINPTSENIAVDIYEKLKPKLTGAPASLSCVEIWESPQSRAIYSPD
jgi:6-pyruvoyltetrahydropterin/6-carboxytetrahydropterin synthase